MTDEQFEVLDPQNRSVVLRKAQFRHHIQQAHDELNAVDIILRTVQEASSIWRETRYPNSQVYYREGAHPDHPRRCVRVVVRDGEVVTAHLINKPRGRSHVLIWTAES